MAKTNNKTRVGVVLPTRLNVREKPNGRIVGLIKQNAEVEVLSERNGWLKIRYLCAYAFVSAQFVDVKEEAE